MTAKAAWLAAVERGAVRLLIERGAALDVSAKSGLTPTMLAVIGGHAEVVRALVENDEDSRAGGDAPREGRKAMTPEEGFLAYALAFEEAYQDDDWSRIEQFFAADATYEVRAGAYRCRLDGPQAIVAGFKKSLDGFDRRLDSRAVEVIEAPRIDGDTVTVGWAASYTRVGAPDLRFAGRSIATVRDGRIVALVDDYAPEEAERLATWIATHGSDLDLSYD